MAAVPYSVSRTEQHQDILARRFQPGENAGFGLCRRPKWWHGWRWQVCTSPQEKGIVGGSAKLAALDFMIAWPSATAAANSVIQPSELSDSARYLITPFVADTEWC